MTWAAAGALVVAAGYAAPAAASVSAGTVRQAQYGVAPTAVQGTPELAGKALEHVRQLAQCGGTMYAVGNFTSISQDGTSHTRNNIFSFSATSPFTLTSWAPDVNGLVNSIAFNGSDCAEGYIGGDFTSVNGTPVHYLAEISTSTGDVDSAFSNYASGFVNTLLAVDGHLLVGGSLPATAGSGRAMVSLNPATGRNDNFLRLNIAGVYSYCNAKHTRCTNDHTPMVYNQQLSHGGTLDLVEGIFTSVGGQPRQQIFMLNLATNPATVTGWTSPQWDGSNPSYPYQCDPREAFYIRAAAWSPDDSTVYIATTGNHWVGWNGRTYPLTGLCDTTASFPATQKPVTDNWIEYTGCDSYYSVAADGNSVYSGGHERFAENPDACNSLGRGGVKDYGLQGFDPDTGKLDVNPGGTPMYSMARNNADDMLLTKAGLWIASSNRFGSDWCTSIYNVAGICFLPYPAGS
jgi:hypothetical protein